ncbi:MAG: hypothetical protein M0Q24_04440 [Sulfurimonas sp.]|uniref:hypothetical protein n=1 Tax=Sulfurimonas sp. TaxID=2022749 RepID=UPI0025DE5B19|nr:hypothetical protein [Sulfurimonas sp.]MCK9491316.1 hypothetical protein [Sulfurimonas sp.]
MKNKIQNLENKVETMNINEIRSLIAKRRAKLIEDYMREAYLTTTQEEFLNSDSKLKELETKFEAIKKRTPLNER